MSNNHSCLSQIFYELILSLSLPQFEALGEAVLGFTKPDDLEEGLRLRS
ncbi:MAG: DUF4351 domain-containing protein [Cyanobacteriota bacterium]|nr:DUF4351 domain-containing protein [Cyanobacteriota bacterium]